MVEFAEEMDWSGVSVFSFVAAAVVVVVDGGAVEAEGGETTSTGVEAAISFETSSATSFDTVIGRAATRLARFVVPPLDFVVDPFLLPLDLAVLLPTGFDGNPAVSLFDPFLPPSLFVVEAFPFVPPPPPVLLSPPFEFSPTFDAA